MNCLMHLLHSSEGISEEAVLVAFRLFWESVSDEVESTKEEDVGNEEAAVLVSFKLFWESVSDEVECTEEVDEISAEEEFKFDQVEGAEEHEEAASILGKRLHCIYRLYQITEIIQRDFHSLETFLKNLDGSDVEGVLDSANILIGQIKHLSLNVGVCTMIDGHDFEILVKKNLPAAENRSFWNVLCGLKERVRENYEKLNELRQQSILKFQDWDQEEIKFVVEYLVSTMDTLGQKILKMLGSSFLMESHAHMYSNNILENMKLGEEVNQEGATDEEV